jgi:hypothetical protein
MVYRTILLLHLSFSILLSACGTRGTPVIRPEILESKLSVLMITSDKLSDPVKQKIGAKLLEWRSGNQIAFEWMKDKAAIDESMITSIKSKPYDYIYVIGTDLFLTAMQAAGQDKDSKWTLIQDQMTTQQLPAESDNVSILQIDPKQAADARTNWVNQLLAQKESVEWVTFAENPIPAEWAPSEEADHIVLLNNNGDWFNQLNYQTLLHGSKWIIFNASTDASFGKRAKTIGVSVVDLTAPLEADLNWDAILAGRLNMMTGRTWVKGIQAYNGQEMKQLLIK